MILLIIWLFIKLYFSLEWIEEYKNKFIDVKKVKVEIDEFLKKHDEDKAKVFIA